MARILIAKVGTDAHDMGITVVERWLADAGHEVVNMGLYNTPERVARAAAEIRPDIVGLSFLGGEPVLLSGRVLEALAGHGAENVKLVVGGVLTPDVIAELGDLGVAETFTPGTLKDEILARMARIVAGSGHNLPPEGDRTNTGGP